MTVSADEPHLKWANTLTEVDELIRRRWSPRSFEDREVPPTMLYALLEAARWAPSSANEQPWRFIVATKAEPEKFDKVLQVLVPGNQEWAQNAPVLIISVAKNTFTKNGTTNRHNLHDTGAATAFLMLQATAMGLYAHAMAGIDYERARTELSIPADYDIGAAIAVGYLGNPEKLKNERHRALEITPRSRKSIEEITFSGKWGEPLKLEK